MQKDNFQSIGNLSQRVVNEAVTAMAHVGNPMAHIFANIRNRLVTNHPDGLDRIPLTPRHFGSNIVISEFEAQGERYEMVLRKIT